MAVLVVVLLAAVTPFVVYAAPGVVGGEESYIVLSGSMAPAIETGDVIVIERVDPESIQVGDVISFDRPGQATPVTHRVVAVDSDHIGPYFRTKGDATEVVDSMAVRPADLRGRLLQLELPAVGPVDLILPEVGNLVLFANTPMGFAVVVALPVTGLLVLEMRQLIAAAGDGATETPTESGTEDVPVAADGAEESAGEVSFTKRDLNVTTVVLAGFAVYSGAIAYLTGIGWTVAVFVLTVGGLLFAVGVRTAAPPVGTAEPVGPADSRIVSARLPALYRLAPRARVDSLEELARIADRTDRSIIDDTEGDGYFLPDGEVVLFVGPDDETEDADGTAVDGDEDDILLFVDAGDGDDADANVGTKQ